jgi:hypothetical protein
MIGVKALTIALIQLATPPFAEAQSTKTLLRGDIPLAVKIQRLSKYFSPIPGQEILISSRELRDFPKSKVNPLNLRGTIKVSPPKGYCFTITRQLDQSDKVICQPSELHFKLAEMGRHGKIQWEVKTGEEDFGTPLEWPTPYRLAYLIPVSLKTPQKSDADNLVEYRVIASCVAQKSSVLGKKINIRFFDKEEWVIDFPEHEEPLPQPDPPPNLFISVAHSKGGIASTKKDNPNPGQDQTRDKTASTGAGTGTGKSTETGNETAAETTEKDASQQGKSPSQKSSIDLDDDRAVWGIPQRYGYRMDGHRFMPYGTTTKWFKGECRYTYLGSADDPSTGRIECHDVDGFKEIYLPLTCLNDLR